MRTLTVDMPGLAQAMDDALHEYLLDLRSGQLIAVDPDAPDPALLAAYEDMPQRYLPVEPLGNADRLAMRESFLFELQHPHAHPVLAAALGTRKPLRTFAYELEQFPEAREAWRAYEQRQLLEYAQAWLHEQGLEPGEAPRDWSGIPEGIRRRLEKGVEAR